MASIYHKGKKHQDKDRTGKAFSGSRFVFPVCFLLTLFLVTTVVPTLAQPPTIPNLKQIVQQPPTAAELLQQGRQRYEAGQLFEATILWQQAANAYATDGALLNQAQALNYLASAYQDLGTWERSRQAIEKSLTLLQRFEELDLRGVAILAQALNTHGRLQLATGQPEAALESWKQAERAYDRAQNQAGKLGSQINQAQALQTLGNYQRARRLLEQLVKQLQTQPDSQLKADSLRSLGVALQTVGDLLQSKDILEQSWSISQRLNTNADTSATLLSIGNVAQYLQQEDVAWQYYQEAANRAEDPLSRVQAQLNQLSLLVKTQQWKKAGSLVPPIESNLSQLSPSRPAVYARINLAEILMKMGHETINSPEINHQLGTISDSHKIARLLATAVQQARQLSDPRAEAFSLYQLGKLYVENQQWDNGKSLIEPALQIAQMIDAEDIIARAAGELGRIFKQQNNITAAIAAYRNAFDSLQALRLDLVAMNREAEFEFRENVEPIYRELVSLLLTPEDGEIPQANLKEALEVIEALQLAELDNFFGDACLDTQPVQIDQIDTQAAVIYPIILEHSLDVILLIPNQPLHHYAIQLPRHDVERILENLYSSLFLGYSSNERLQLSELVYDWLIRPSEVDLVKNNIKTLVFVLDGFLRNLPMAALYDGQQYLVEKYGIALSPGLQLFPEGLDSNDSRVLAAAITEARQGFSALPKVEAEIQQLSAELRSQILLNQEFTLPRLQNTIDRQSFPIVHLATHGQFSSKLEETFLLTWNERITVKDLDRLFQNSRLGIVEPIELLVMSACQTAVGDKRATLGLAGFALRSGARSTLGSLWSVNDESTAELMSEFYRQLTRKDRNLTKAEALRQAQVYVLRNPLHKHPYFWASFVLVGNWI